MDAYIARSSGATVSRDAQEILSIALVIIVQGHHSLLSIGRHVSGSFLGSLYPSIDCHFQALQTALSQFSQGYLHEERMGEGGWRWLKLECMECIGRYAFPFLLCNWLIGQAPQIEPRSIVAKQQIRPRLIPTMRITGSLRHCRRIASRKIPIFITDMQHRSPLELSIRAAYLGGIPCLIAPRCLLMVAPIFPSRSQVRHSSPLGFTAAIMAIAAAT